MYFPPSKIRAVSYSPFTYCTVKCIYVSLPDGGQFELPSICLSPPPALLKIYLKHLAGRTTHEEGVESVKFLNFKLDIASALPTFVSPWAISVPQSKKRRYYT